MCKHNCFLCKIIEFFEIPEKKKTIKINIKQLGVGARKYHIAVRRAPHGS